MITIHEILKEIENFAPPAYQESYDNASLITGDRNQECTGVILCLDAIEPVLEEAIEKGCNLIIAHHPIVFSGLKSITGKTYIERVMIKAIRNNIAIYAAHTNLDNVRMGVNAMIAHRLGLTNTRILAPKKGVLKKLFTYITREHAPALLEGLFAAGAGDISNYSECSFTTPGIGTFKGNEVSSPAVGVKGVREYAEEHKIEVVFPAYKEQSVLSALRKYHYYEEIAYEVITLDNEYQEVGSGLIGELPTPVPVADFMHFLKVAMQTPVIRHTEFVKADIKRVAVCGGAGSFLLPKAISAGADVLVSADFKYHQFFDAEGKIIIADIGHYESEQFTIELFHNILKQKFSNFALHLTNIPTNPVKYI